MLIAHLMASPFFGGPEKQMLGLARALPASHSSVFLSFPERGLCRPFLAQVRRHGFEAIELVHNFPRLFRVIRELTETLRNLRADILTCSTYKPDLLGYLAARRLGIPVVAVCHGWTWANWRARFYEALDRRILRSMDQAVCVSQAQADKVLKAGVAPDKIKVIRNAIDDEAFDEPRPEYGDRLRGLFADPPRYLVGGAGRLSPEKGFDQLIEAAAIVRRQRDDVGFVIFGEGPMQQRLEHQIQKLGLARSVVLAGFRTDVAQFLPHLDLVVLPSFTEGLPVVLLEAFAAGVPVVGTTVGGIPEVIENGRSGWLVPPGEPAGLAERIVAMFQDDEARRAKGQVGRERVRRDFTFRRMADEYRQLFDQLMCGRESGPLLDETPNLSAAAECIR